MNDQFIPPFMDLQTLSRHVCLSDTTIEAHVKLGIFPAPKMQGGKRLWRWKDVERHLGKSDDGVSSTDIRERVKNGTRKALEDAKNHV